MNSAAVRGCEQVIADLAHDDMHENCVGDEKWGTGRIFSKLNTAY